MNDWWIYTVVLSFWHDIVFLTFKCALQTILAVQPDVVLLELCHGRRNILAMDEEMLLKEAKNLNLAKIRNTIQQVGLNHLRS